MYDSGLGGWSRRAVFFILFLEEEEGRLSYRLDLSVSGKGASGLS